MKENCENTQKALETRSAEIYYTYLYYLGEYVFNKRLISMEISQKMWNECHGTGMVRQTE